MPRTSTKLGFTPTACECCAQTTNYITGVDKGIVDIVRAFAVAIRAKGVNVIHPTKEMSMAQGQLSREEAIRGGRLTPSQQKNLSRARSHGLLARVKGAYGNWCLTRKAIDFLKGEPIEKYAVISKVTGETIGYWQPEKYTCTLHSFVAIPPEGYWSESIEHGHVVKATDV